LVLDNLGKTVPDVSTNFTVSQVTPPTLSKKDRVSFSDTDNQLIIDLMARSEPRVSR